MRDQENESEEFYSSEESLLSEPEPDELDNMVENRIYIWLCLGILVILALSFLSV